MRILSAFVFCFAGFAGSLFAQKGSGLVQPTMDVVNFADTVHHYEKMSEFGFFLGATRFNSDISNEDYFNTKQNIGPMAGLFFRKPLSPFFALRASLLAGKLSDKDDNYTAPDWRKTRHFTYETTVGELSARMEWDIFGKRRYRRGVDTTQYTLDKHTQYALVNGFHRSISPFVFAGVGLTGSKAKTTYNYDTEGLEGYIPWIAEDSKKAEGFNMKPSVSAGGGLHFDLGPRFVLGTELGAHMVLGDYLDGISAAGNPDSRDWFFFAGLTMGFRLGTNDRDRDGVPNKLDKCPDIPGPGITKGCPDIDHDEVADREDDCPHKKGIRALAGCPIKDADEDGVPDIDDYCPNVAGLAQFKGCPDTDGDGIEDKADSCKTIAGLAQFNGCPDTDSDGIEDKLDACPTEPGPAEYYYGCPVRDTDGDGVEDKLDACLLAKGKPEFKGCPDSDNDGIEDKADPCPNTPGPKENRGCPVVEKKDKEKLQLAVKAVKFQTGKAILKPESSKILTDISDILKKYPHYSLRIEGHTDNQGKDEANLVLSEKRAQACADFLTAKGVDKSRFKVKGFGEAKPVADNKTATGRAKNRRVEFELVLPE